MNNKKLYIIGIVTFIVIIGAFLYRQGKNGDEEQAMTDIEPVPTIPGMNLATVQAASTTTTLVNLTTDEADGEAYAFRDMRKNMFTVSVYAHLGDNLQTTDYEVWLQDSQTLDAISLGIMNLSNETYSLTYESPDISDSYDTVLITPVSEDGNLPYVQVLMGILE